MKVVILLLFGVLADATFAASLGRIAEDTKEAEDIEDTEETAKGDAEEIEEGSQADEEEKEDHDHHHHHHDDGEHQDHHHHNPVAGLAFAGGLIAGAVSEQLFLLDEIVATPVEELLEVDALLEAPVGVLLEAPVETLLAAAPLVEEVLLAAAPVAALG